MRAIISFSLFGNTPKYLVGAIENTKLSKVIYPGWDCRFYVDDLVPKEVIYDLQCLGANIIEMPRSDGFTGCFWRFIVADDIKYDYWIVRDVDSRLSYRERRAVDEWLISGYPFHLMHDHPCHIKPIMGCAIGGVCGAIEKMEEKVNSWKKKNAYCDDEEFLARIIYPLIKDKAIDHNSFASRYDERVRKFPTPFEAYRFVGERVLENEIPEQKEMEILISALKTMDSK